MQLTEKENMLVKELIASEKLCVEKYDKASNNAKDGGLKNLFTAIKASEQTHLDSLNQVAAGTVPNMNAPTNCPKPQAPTTPANLNPADSQADAYLCSDALTTEKQVSGMYNTSIFEFAQPELRNVLNHIQKEEQEHGEAIYTYMATNNMYN